MNERTDLLMSSYQPVIAITVYRSQNNMTGQGEYYLESHDINSEGKIMQGKPLIQETIQEIVDVFFDERKNVAKISGMIPDNLLSFNLMPGGHYKMIWYRPAEERVLHFSTSLKIPTAKAWVPALVYVVERNDLSMYALKSNARPKEATKLCYAPFFNIGSDGRVCLGSAKVKAPKEKTYENIMKYWEDLFWLSEFTHVNGSDDKTVTKLQPLWQKIMKPKTKKKWSELNELKQYQSTTLKNILK